MRQARTILFLFVVLATAAPVADAKIYLTIIRKPENTAAQRARESAALEARRQLNQAQSALMRAQNLAMQNNPHAIELRQAQADLAKARQRHAQAVGDAKFALLTKTDLGALNTRIWNLEDRLSVEKDPARRSQIAFDLLDLRSRRSKLEGESLGMNPEVTVAQAGLQEAVTHLRNVETLFHWHVNKDPGVESARAAVDQARQRLLSVGN
jgi:multidrug resistance efflux pump